jgi:tripartite-type tricarboxylate transporter receptor subunit TctC
VLSCTQPAKAQDTIDRPVTIYVAGTAGGGIDLYARLVAATSAATSPANRR